MIGVNIVVAHPRSPSGARALFAFVGVLMLTFLAVEPQEVVLGLTESADGCVGLSGYHVVDASYSDGASCAARRIADLSSGRLARKPILEARFG